MNHKEINEELKRIGHELNGLSTALVKLRLDNIEDRYFNHFAGRMLDQAQASVDQSLAVVNATAKRVHQLPQLKIDLLDQ